MGLITSVISFLTVSWSLCFSLSPCSSNKLATVLIFGGKSNCYWSSLILACRKYFQQDFDSTLAVCNHERKQRTEVISLVFFLTCNSSFILSVIFYSVLLSCNQFYTFYFLATHAFFEFWQYFPQSRFLFSLNSLHFFLLKVLHICWSTPSHACLKKYFVL